MAVHRASVDPKTAVPARLTAGDSDSIRLSFADVSPGDGYTLTLRIVATSGKIVEMTATEETSSFLFPIATTDLADLPPGVASWTISAAKTGERLTLDHGVIQIDPDPENSASAGSSKLAHIERVIAACEAAIEGKMTDDVQMYQLPGGVTVSKMSMREVRETLAAYKARRRRILNGGRPSIREVWYAPR